MSNFDLRALLQYVPQFRGRCFVVCFSQELMAGDDWRDATLDLAALQGLGVNLVVAGPAGDFERLYEQLIRLDLKVAKVTAESRVSAVTVLSRGQAAVVPYEGGIFSSQMVELSLEVKATKLIWLLSADLPLGSSVALHAVPAGSPMPVTDQPDLMDLAAKACRAGVRRVHLLDARSPNVILAELFSNEGVGVMIYSDAYRELSQLSEEDIPELLSLIGRSVYDALLLDRSYEDIAQRLEEYHVLKVDGNVVGCVAVHPYPADKLAEIACLRIKDNHEGLGYGRSLVKHAEAVAKRAGYEKVFALSQSAADFFRNRANYEEWTRDKLPPERRDLLERSGRSSAVFVKSL